MRRDGLQAERPEDVGNKGKAVGDFADGCCLTMFPLAIASQVVSDKQNRLDTNRD